ncbi:extensin family protein [Hyphobacterium sp. HN65]|uniref:Extensin family protein n=1 Tax=Hyphobacterium lacteum TaxID=3116575 RepID=A0ABU7LRS0_9PROT|nr:extensin family protein [Hyphobacterium sp. HN65]MEE2526575.1 extensin family protein [Hyphobacterium sp. HN65]
MSEQQRLNRRKREERWAGLPMSIHIAVRGAIVMFALLGILAVFFYIESMPDGASAWGEADLEEPIRLFTSEQIRALREDPQACFAALDGSNMSYAEVEPQSRTPECRWQAGVQISTSNLDYADPEPPVASCALAAALYVWEREIVAPAAARHLDAEVAEILHYGTYNCRRENSSQAGRWSQHAGANAIDISGFRLTDGRVIGVHRWDNGGEDAAFLVEVRDRSCEIFTGVLGPDYNAAHADHFHLDMGPWEICS